MAPYKVGSLKKKFNMESKQESKKVGLGEPVTE
jgi:hypothetical protein